jgi:hypothetical protein
VVIGERLGSRIQPAKPYDLIGDLACTCGILRNRSGDGILSRAWRLRVSAKSQASGTGGECDEQFVEGSEYRRFLCYSVETTDAVVE